MPKVTITDGKGLVQEPGAGLVVKSSLAATTSGAAIRKKVIAASGGNVTLTAADSGCVVFVSGGARTVTLPAVAVAGAGWYCDVIAASAHAHIVDTGEDNILYGQWVDATNGTTIASVQITAQQLATLVNPKIGDHIGIISDGTNFYLRVIANQTATLAQA